MNFAIDMAYIAEFWLLVNIFLSQLTIVFNYYIQSFEIICNIMHLLPDKSIYKLLYNNSYFLV